MPRIPNALEMRSLKYRGSSDAAKDQVAQALRAEGRRAEALLLFDGRPKAPFLREELAWARQEGVAFHLLHLRRLGVDVGEADLRACAAAAEKSGRWMDARQCYDALGDRAALLAIAEHLPPSLRPDPAPEEDVAP